MNMSDLELPSNKKLGFFFSAVSFLIGFYFYLNNSALPAYTLFSLGLLLLAVTFVKPDLLLPLNKLWMRFGLLIGMIVSPIVLGIIFFGLFMPIGFFMRFIKRDELRLRFNSKSTYWISRDISLIKPHTFKHQF